MVYFENRPTPGKEICDFCSDPHPRWRFHVESFTALPRETLPFVSESVGDWAACEMCRVLIEARNQPALTQRSYLMLIRLNPEILLLPEVGSQIKSSLSTLHQQFFTHLKSPVGIRIV